MEGEVEEEKEGIPTPPKTGRWTFFKKKALYIFLFYFYLLERRNRRAAGIGADRLASRKGMADRRWASSVEHQPGTGSLHSLLAYLYVCVHWIVF